jgi:hypothetical protein
MVALDDIYDAAFDKARFPALIERLVRAFGARAGFIGWSDMERGVGFQAEFGNDPHWLQQYIDTYAELDIMRPLLQSVPEGVCAPAHLYMQAREIRESRFYREYLAPQGVIDNLAVNLIKRPGIMAHLALIRMAPAEPFGPGECERLALLVPHLRRAVYIQSHVVRAADHAAAIHGSAGAARQSMLLTADRTVAEIDPPLAARLRLRGGDALGDGVVGTLVQRAVERGSRSPARPSTPPACLCACSARSGRWSPTASATSPPAPRPRTPPTSPCSTSPARSRSTPSPNSTALRRPS